MGGKVDLLWFGSGVDLVILVEVLDGFFVELLFGVKSSIGFCIVVGEVSYIVYFDFFVFGSIEV